MTHRHGAIIVATLAVIGAAGCAGPTSNPSDTSPAGTGPVRPATLPLNNTNPCTLLTGTERTQLGVGAGQYSTTDYGGPNHGPSCSWLSPHGHPTYTYGGFLVLNRGVEAVHSSEPPRTVDGFRAVTTGTLGTDPTTYCQVFADVAPHQALSTSFETSSLDPVPGLTHQAACDRAQHLAEMMINNLRGHS